MKSLFEVNLILLIKTDINECPIDGKFSNLSNIKKRILEIFSKRNHDEKVKEIDTPKIDLSLRG